MRRLIILATFVVASLGLLASFAGAAAADSVGAITFEPSQGYTLGSINGQNDWLKTGPYDVAVASIGAFPDAVTYGFGDQALRLSNSITSGSFGDQTFSPGLLSPAGESAAKHFDASFQIGTAFAAEQPGLSMSVSPDNGVGGRMSYLRFEDHFDGVHVFFDDITGTEAFNETDIATLNRTNAHTIRFLINFKVGPVNDDVKIFVDGKKLITGTTWEGYYPLVGESVPTVSKLLFRLGGTANPSNVGNGFLVDNLTLADSA